jgi:hypothetical protein
LTDEQRKHACVKIIGEEVMCEKEWPKFNLGDDDCRELNRKTQVDSDPIPRKLFNLVSRLLHLGKFDFIWF